MENRVEIVYDREYYWIKVVGDSNEIPDDKIDQLIRQANMCYGKFSEFVVIRKSPNGTKEFKFYDYIVNHPRLEELMKIEINYSIMPRTRNKEVKQKFLECARAVFVGKTGIPKGDTKEISDDNKQAYISDMESLRQNLENAKIAEQNAIEALRRAQADLEKASAARREAELRVASYVPSEYVGFTCIDWIDELIKIRDNESNCPPNVAVSKIKSIIFNFVRAHPAPGVPHEVRAWDILNGMISGRCDSEKEIIRKYNIFPEPKGMN